MSAEVNELDKLGTFVSQPHCYPAMPLKRDQKVIAYRVLTVVQYGLGTVSAIIGASLKADIAKISTASPLLGELVADLQRSAWWSVPLFTLCLPLLQFVKSWVGDPTVWETIHKLLEEMRTKAFPDETADHHHRVTLFQHRRFCWRGIRAKEPTFGGWLVPVERSGDTTQNPKVFFYAPKDNPDAAQGVAGMVWASKGALRLQRLPELSTTSTDAQFALYAEKARCSVEHLRQKVGRNKILARSFWGTVVKRNGDVWGVVLIDSRAADLPDDREISETFKPIGVCINKLLEVI